jgi:hypothetical protein
VQLLIGDYLELLSIIGFFLGACHAFFFSCSGLSIALVLMLEWVRRYALTGSHVSP